MIRRNRRVASPEFTSYEEAWAFAGPKVKQIADDIAEQLQMVQEALAAEGIAVEVTPPFEDHSDDYGFLLGIAVTEPDSATGDLNDDLTVDVQVSLLDSTDASEPTDPDWGVNISVNVSTAAGRMLGGYAPYNYSDRVWTKSPEELTSRMDQFDASAVADAITDFYAKNA